jgi:hypothetical protein
MDRLMALQAFPPGRFPAVVEDDRERLGSAIGAGSGASTSASAGGGHRLCRVLRYAVGLEPGRATNRYNESRLLCEPRVFAGAWNPTPTRGAVRTPMRQLCFKSHRTSHGLEFARDGQKVQLTLDGILAANDHDANVVAGLMNLGIVKVANYVARPYLESGRLKQL